MAFLVLSSTFSFAIGKHYCGDFLIDTAVFSEVEKCTSEADAIAKKPCCKDTLDLIEGQDELQHTDAFDLTIDSQVVYLAHVLYASLYYEALPKQSLPFYYYDPPDLVFDIQLLDEVFLI